MTKGRTGERESYHHGDPRLAPNTTTDAILRERGIEGFPPEPRGGPGVSAAGHHFGIWQGC